MFGFKNASQTLPEPFSPRSARSRLSGIRLKMFSLPRRSIFVILCGFFLFTLLTISHQLQLTTAQFRNYSNWIRTHGEAASNANLGDPSISNSGGAKNTETTKSADIATPVYLKQEAPMLYDRASPPGIGCSAVVDQSRKKLIWEYSKELRGYTKVNVFGSNAGNGDGSEEDAFIWTSQQMLLQNFGIQIAETCSSAKQCNFTSPHPLSKGTTYTTPSPHPILISSSSSPSLNPRKSPNNLLTLLAIRNLPSTKLHTFPLPHRHIDPLRTQETINAYNSHPSLHIFTSDPISRAFLKTHFPASQGLQSKLVPDIGFIWGDRSDLRVRWKRRVDVLVLGSGEGLREAEWAGKLFGFGIRKGFGQTDVELAIQPGNGTDEYNPEQEYVEGDKWHLNPMVQKLKYWRGDWRDLSSYIQHSSSISTDEAAGKEKIGTTEELSKLAWQRTMAALEHLASARLIITDRLHVHVMATILGIPHILLDRSSEGVLLDHDVWTRECACTRVVGSMDEAWAMVKRFLVGMGGTMEYLVGEGRLGEDMGDA